MSLGITLTRSITLTQYQYFLSIPDELMDMAEAAGLYRCLWKPETMGITKAVDMIEPLMNGLNALKDYPNLFREYTPVNKACTYETFVEYVEDYLNFCRDNPDCSVSTDG